MHLVEDRFVLCFLLLSAFNGTNFIGEKVSSISHNAFFYFVLTYITMISFNL